MEELIVAFWNAMTYFSSEIDFFESTSESWSVEYTEMPDLDFVDHNIYISQMPS